MISNIDLIGDDGCVKQICTGDFSNTKNSYVDNEIDSIGDNAFYNCTGLTTVNFPMATSIGSNAFNGCTGLTSVNFPMVTSIGDNAFYNCTGLTTVDFPLVANIGMSAFYTSSSLISGLVSVILRKQDTICTLSDYGAFNGTPIRGSGGQGYVYVPSALVDAYKANSNWKSSLAKFRALEDYTINGTITGDLDPTKI